MKLLKTRIPFFPLWPEFIDLDGVRVPLKGSPLDAKTRRRLMRGLYEDSERDLIRQFIQPGDQILELGASVGIVTCFLAKQAAPSGRLLCVEPNAFLQRPFQTQIELNHVTAEWVNALACPLWADEVPGPVAQMTFAASDRSLSGRATHEIRESSPPTPWQTALNLCRQRRFTPTALVVDIEGSEAVWAEYQPHIPHSIRTVIAEFHPHLTGSRIAGRAIQSILDEGFAVRGLHQTVIAFERK